MLLSRKVELRNYDFGGKILLSQNAQKFDESYPKQLIFDNILRFSSVQLLGDLLYRISGVTGKMSTETANEDDNFGTEHSHKVCRPSSVLSALCVGL